MALSASVFRSEVCWTSPALHRGRVYLRSPTQAACIDVRAAASPEPTVPAGPALVAQTTASEPFDIIALIGKEREFPFDPPDLREFTRWYLWSFCGAIFGAWCLAGCVGLVFRGIGGRLEALAQPAASATLWTAALVLGVAVTPVANGVCDGFVFTWPASLFVFHELVLVAVVWSNRRSDAKSARWVAPAAALAMVAVCALYYDLCRRLNLALAWVFLAGFLASWPIAVPLAYRLGKARGVSACSIWLAGAFSLYFWASAALLWARTAMAR